MLPAILKFDIEGFGKANEKVMYQKYKEPKLKEKIGTEDLYEIRNASGKVVVCEADAEVFRLRRVK